MGQQCSLANSGWLRGARDPVLYGERKAWNCLQCNSTLHSFTLPLSKYLLIFSCGSVWIESTEKHLPAEVLHDQQGRELLFLHLPAAVSAPISYEFLPWECYRSVARVGLDQISPAILVRSCTFWFLLLTSRAVTKSRANSQGDTDNEGEKSQKLDRSHVLEMDKACGNKYSGTFRNKTEKEEEQEECKILGWEEPSENKNF